MEPTPFIIVSLLAGFEWFDEGLQRSLKAAGWPVLTRPESMVMMHVQMNIVRPADIARSLGLTRQAVHATIATLVDRGVFQLAPDPIDRRIRVVELTAMGNAMRRDAMRIVTALTGALEERIGGEALAALRSAFVSDWGEPLTMHITAGPAKAAG